MYDREGRYKIRSVYEVISWYPVSLTNPYYKEAASFFEVKSRVNA